MAPAGGGAVGWGMRIEQADPADTREAREPMASLYNAMSDAPREPELAPQFWDAARIRERISLRPRFGMRDYAVAARHDDTGELAD